MAIPLTLSNVPDETPYIQYVASGGQTVYPYPFPITQDSDLVVVINGVTQNTDSTYSLSGQGNPTGGNVTLNSGSTAGDVITLYRDVQIERLTQFAQNGGFASSAFNAEFNNLYLIAQQLEAAIEQCLQIPNTNNPSPAVVLTKALYAGKYLAFDQYGNPTPALLTPSGALTQAILGSFLYPQTPAETTAFAAHGGSVVNTFIPAGFVYRYGTNTTPGTTDMTSAVNVAANVCRQGNYVLQLPAETCLVSGSLNFSGIRVSGSTSFTGVSIQATVAQFNVITSTGQSTFENFTVHGGWDGTTAGLSGDTFYLVGASNAYNIHFHNVLATFNKKRGVFWQTAGYSNAENLQVTPSGLHGIEIEGLSAVSLSTTVDVYGNSRFSDCPNGYGVKITECIETNFRGCIIENTKGIQLNGSDNRALTFEQIYQEGTAGGLFIDGTGSAGTGLRVIGCYGGNTSAIANISSWEDVWFEGNSGLTEPPIPFPNRIFQVDGGAQTTTTTGGVDVTAVQITLNPGVYMVFATLQTLEAVSGALSQTACQITTSASASGLNNNTNSSWNPFADQLNLNPGAAEDVRLNAFALIAPTVSTTYYVRAHFNISAGTLGYRAFLNAVLIK